MSLTEGLLTAIVIILTVILLLRQDSTGQSMCSRICDSFNQKNENIIPSKIKEVVKTVVLPKLTPEKTSLNENAEFFANNSSVSTQETLSAICGDDDKFAYAVNEFGGPGMEFKDWVASQSVDGEVIKNHAAFVKDRLGDNKQNIVGRTYSPDSHDSYDPVPWVGLRRPQAVEVNNPTQVPDVDMGLYSDKPKFTWASS